MSTKTKWPPHSNTVYEEQKKMIYKLDKNISLSLCTYTLSSWSEWFLSSFSFSSFMKIFLFAFKSQRTKRNKRMKDCKTSLTVHISAFSLNKRTKEKTGKNNHFAFRYCEHVWVWMLKCKSSKLSNVIKLHKNYLLKDF